ncbi:MAG: anti-sigma factor antagonist [Clostridia bacterium]|nr:anti-sigma factor antagonist [Clostridia bacterium]
MEMRLEYLGSTLVAKLEGEIDQSCAGEIRERLDKDINLHGIINLIMDFDKVSFMDSSGIGMLIGRYKLIKARGGKLMIVRVAPHVKKVMDVAGLSKIMDFE